jgi:hypothetical protein
MASNGGEGFLYKVESARLSFVEFKGIPGPPPFRKKKD